MIEAPPAPRRPPVPPGRPVATEPTSGRPVGALAALVFVGSFAFRFLDPGWVNDHFRLLAQARQILDGELPVRDFPDPGVFLQIHASAAFQLLFGYSLFGEALLCIFFLSAGYALTFLLATRASRSALIGLVVTILVIAMYPRLFAYDKVFLLVFGLWVCWRYVDRPTARNLAVVAFATAFAFLFRHDHGVYIAAGVAAMLAAVHWPEGLRSLLRRFVVGGAFGLIPLLPFLVFLQANGGALEYFRAAIDYTRARGEGKRSGLAEETAFSIDLPSAASSVRLRVRWAEGVTDEVRAELERRYRLAELGYIRERIWRYDLLDTSEANLAALDGDPRVEDRDRIEAAAGRESAQREAPTPLNVARSIFRSANAIPWLYHLFVTLPAVAMIVLVIKRARPRSWAESMSGEGPKIFAAAILCVVADYLLIRRPLDYRLADAAAPTAVIGAWLLGQLLGFRASSPAAALAGRARAGAGPGGAQRFARSFALPALRSIVALALVGVTWLSVATVGDVEAQLEESAVLDGPTAIRERATDVLQHLRTSPPIDAWARPGSVGLRGLTRYVRECTKPTDRLLVTWFAPDVYYYTDRGFAGGQVFWFDNYLRSPEDQQRSIDKLREESVPIIIGRAADSREFAGDYRYVHAYITQNYRLAAQSGFGDDDVLQVFVDTRLTPSGIYQPWSLPCYR